MAEECVAILGPGLLGGSLAMALQQRKLAKRVHVWARRSDAAKDVTARGIADLADTDIAKVIADATLAILATPVPFMADLADRISECPTRADLLVTDVGSVKAPVVDKVGSVLDLAKIAFIGSHPMAGSEKAGIEAARSDLFEGAACIVTPPPSVNPTQLERIESFWGSLGCRVTRLDALDHDQIIARISHVPHLAACALSLATLRHHSEAGEIVGKGFLSSTRIASGDAELWLGILRENQSALLDPLRDLQSELGRVLAILEGFDEGKLLEYLSEAKELRDHCLEAGGTTHFEE